MSLVRPICGVPCAHGGKSASRKHSRADLGWMGHCNRPVRYFGDHCWQHCAAADAKASESA